MIGELLKGKNDAIVHVVLDVKKYGKSKFNLIMSQKISDIQRYF
jgi:hypothetical protein